jgi:hypothetical protein
VSLALFNVAFSSIINFHFYRIFGKKLAKVESKFIKKDENFIIVKAFDNKQFKKNIVLPTGDFENFCIVNNFKFGFLVLENSFDELGIISKQLNDISPSRGSPIIS